MTVLCVMLDIILLPGDHHVHTGVKHRQEPPDHPKDLRQPPTRAFEVMLNRNIECQCECECEVHRVSVDQAPVRQRDSSLAGQMCSHLELIKLHRTYKHLHCTTVIQQKQQKYYRALILFSTI